MGKMSFRVPHHAPRANSAKYAGPRRPVLPAVGGASAATAQQFTLSSSPFYSPMICRDYLGL